MIRTHVLFPLLAATVAVTLVACAETSQPEVTHARIRLPPPGMQMAAAYFEIENPSDQELVLASVSAEGIESVEMHETVQEQGVSRMRQRERVAIPAGEQVRFEPGGLHLMLFGISPELEKNPDTLLQLQLTRADGSTLALPVRFRLTQADGESHAH